MSVGERHVLGAASQLKSIIGGLDLTMVLLDDSEESILLVHLRLGESVGQNLVTQQPGDIRSWTSVAGNARGPELAVGFESSLVRGLGDDLQLWAAWGVSNEQIHGAHEFLRLHSQIASHLSIVDGLHFRDLNSALAALKSVTKVIKLVVRKQWTDDCGLFPVDHEATELNRTGHPAHHSERVTFLLHLRERRNIDLVQSLLRRL